MGAVALVVPFSVVCPSVTREQRLESLDGVCSGQLLEEVIQVRIRLDPVGAGSAHQ
jgi:hypothetical protein